MINGLLTTASNNFEDAQWLSGQVQQQRIALGLAQVARAAKGGQRDSSLLETAARNFDDAQMMKGQAQIQRIALGLTQLARALRH